MATPVDDNREDAVEEAVRQFVDARWRGEEPELDEFVRDYPGLEDQIRESIEDARRIEALFDSLVQVDESDVDGAEPEPDLTGRKIGTFEIAEMIGRGGMGVVYLAHDTKLGRSVAVKSIPAELQTSTTAQARLKREAKLLASLNHPNIAVIHDIVEADSSGYLILEYVPGQNLAERIAQGPLKLQEALSIGRQIAEAVDAAHEKGVVHRDLKPGNIKITPEGKLKVLDFGLAKASVSGDKDVDNTVTQPGCVVGTPAYMSPEQARGKDTNHRTDIWSFGCIMYQMLTGHLPFEGETATDTIARILEREPDWQALAPDTPSHIRTLLHHCLEKDPRRRLANIGDAAVEIKKTLALTAPTTAAKSATLVRTRWTMGIGFVVVTLLLVLAVLRSNRGTWWEKILGRTGPGQIKSLAVLPLQNLTGDPEQEYFVDGLTEALIADLGKIGALQPRSPTSIMQYKDVSKPLSEIARELNVDAVVQGSVLHVGERVRITANLIHAPTDTHLWANSYERNLSDILSLFKEIARSIANEIGITMTPDQEALLVASRKVNPETLNAYLLGMFYLNKTTPEGTKKGLDYLRQAIDKDPSDPLAYGALALGYAVSAHGPGASPDAGPLARKTALQALELDNTLAEAHAALAIDKLYGTWDWQRVERSFQLALRLNSTLTYTRAHYSWYLQLFGRTAEALAQMRQVQEIDPWSPLWPAWLG